MKNDNDLIHFVTQYHRLHRQGAHLNDIFLRAFTGNQKMCRDTLLVSCPHLSVWGLFRLKKKLELVPCSGLQTTFSTLGYTSPICQGKRGGGGEILPVACTERLHQKGVPFSGFRYMKGWENLSSRCLRDLKP